MSDNTTMYQMKVIMVPEGRICQVHDGAAVFIPSKEFLADALKTASPAPEKVPDEKEDTWRDCDKYELTIDHKYHLIELDSRRDEIIFKIEDRRTRDEIMASLMAMDFS